MFDECVTMEGYEKHSFRIKKDSEYQKYSMINWNARYDEVIIGDVEEEEKEKRSLTLIGDGVAYCDTLMYGFDKWIIEKMDFTKGVNEKLK